ncbi:hypothetical protein RRG08_039914 [Elysia crispata]|uniref:Uncharacterized protein n=1 Tax=Elysia crispata TaxID=231223 RepID=A0AAE0XZC3_9GAST|nr:hypothetical protein RRG08_039914 [Elysia crispata]
MLQGSVQWLGMTDIRRSLTHTLKPRVVLRIQSNKSRHQGPPTRPIPSPTSRAPSTLPTARLRTMTPGLHHTSEKEALRELRDNDKITIKPADKGGAVVVMDTTDYIGECTRQLDNTTYYRILTSDPTNSGNNKKIQDAVDKGIEEKEISSEIGKALLVPHPTPGKFYILPKVHKEGNPGRLIIGGNGCPTEIISQFVDYHMKGLVSQLPSYVQDDMDFPEKSMISIRQALFLQIPFYVQWLSAHCTLISHIRKVRTPVV